MNVKIGLNKDIDKARKIIYDYFPDKKVKIKEEDYGSRYLFDIELTKNKSLSKKDFYNKIADIILEIILSIYSKDIIYNKASTDLNNLKANERKEVVNITNEILLNKDNFKIEKENIIHRIKDYLMVYPLIMIDGYIRFRLKEFKFFVNVVIDKGIEEFTAEKEYEEFIKILQYFVDVQDSKYNLINLVFEDDGYKLIDADDNIIDNNFFSEIVAEIDNQGINEDDLLVSSLIVLAPKKLKIHLNERLKNEEVIKVISSVFQDRVYFCLGCEKCNGQIKLKKGK